MRPRLEAKAAPWDGRIAVRPYFRDDLRFLFADPTKNEQNDNYNPKRVLEEAIAAGPLYPV